MYLEIDDLRTGYIDVCEEVLRRGKPVSPRGQATREVLAATVVLHDPTDALPVGIGRNPRLEIGAAEALQLVGGFSAPAMLTSITKTFERFMVGGTLHGAYGPRVYSSMPVVEDRLRHDPDTRQARVTVWDDDYDRDDWPDMPCTTSFTFAIREGKLVCHSSMRSNDVYLGLCYDLFQFGQLQATLASVLDLPVGPLYHQVKSLHIYDRDVPKLDELHAYGGEPFFRPQGFRGASMRHAQLRARGLYDGTIEGATTSECWYADLLRDHVPTRR